MKKYLLSFIFSVAGLSIASAGGSVRGIIATYEGSETSYKLEEVPSVKYETVEGVQYAILYLKDQEEPVLNVALAEGKTLTITYGEYVPTSIDDVATDKVTITDLGGKKMIRGGRLIIIGRDGRMYNAAGVEIKK